MEKQIKVKFAFLAALGCHAFLSGRSHRSWFFCKTGNRVCRGHRRSHVRRRRRRLPPASRPHRTRGETRLTEARVPARSRSGPSPPPAPFALPWETPVPGLQGLSDRGVRSRKPHSPRGCFCTTKLWNVFPKGAPLGLTRMRTSDTPDALRVGAGSTPGPFGGRKQLGGPPGSPGGRCRADRGRVQAVTVSVSHTKGRLRACPSPAFP